ncbi:peptidoglycan-binding protein, partial [Oceanobacillus oncorhynchi]|uniref:peptidoglycan-binding domain-containing protein n=1 Tax=Oceanobacillus oncorhynchi TaxID=545501 RepID=UPI002F965C48
MRRKWFPFFLVILLVTSPFASVSEVYAMSHSSKEDEQNNEPEDRDKESDVDEQDSSTDEAVSEEIKLKLGDEDEQILDLKEDLTELGFAALEKPTTYYGLHTEEAVKAFQKFYDIEDTGVADEDTLLQIEYILADDSFDREEHLEFSKPEEFVTEEEEVEELPAADAEEDAEAEAEEETEADAEENAEEATEEESEADTEENAGEATEEESGADTEENAEEATEEESGADTEENAEEATEEESEADTEESTEEATEEETEADTEENAGEVTEEESEADAEENAGEATEEESEADAEESTEEATEEESGADTEENAGEATEEESEADAEENAGEVTEEESEADAEENAGEATEEESEADAEEQAGEATEEESKAEPEENAEVAEEDAEVKEQQIGIQSFARATVFSTQSNSLQKGTSSAQAKKLKENLKSLGYLSLPNPNNYFGVQTEKAVKDFQRQFGLTVNGIANQTTIAKIEEVLKSPLQKGKRNASSKTLKENLKSLGYLTLSNPNNYYGVQTENAVRAFQKDNGLAQSGIADKITLDKIKAELNKVPQKGTRTGEVKKLKENLNRLGFTSFQNPTNYFGVQTERGVQDFQKQFGL